MDTTSPHFTDKETETRELNNNTRLTSGLGYCFNCPEEGRIGAVPMALAWQEPGRAEPCEGIGVASFWGASVYAVSQPGLGFLQGEGQSLLSFSPLVSTAN